MNLRITQLKTAKLGIWKQSVTEQDSEILDEIMSKSTHMGPLHPAERKQVLRSGRKVKPRDTDNLRTIVGRLVALGKRKDAVPKRTLKTWMDDIAAAQLERMRAQCMVVSSNCIAEVLRNATHATLMKAFHALIPSERVADTPSDASASFSMMSSTSIG
jgi:hypothetical protein